MSLSWNSDKCSGIYDGCGTGGLLLTGPQGRGGDPGLKRQMSLAVLV